MFYICSMSGLHIIWFEHDLRVHDHAALRAACQTAERDGGQVLALYIHRGPAARFEMAPIENGGFLIDALADLRAALSQRDALLHVRSGDPPEVLSELHKQHRIVSVHRHQSVLPVPRLPAVEAWALRAGVRFEFYPQFDPQVPLTSHEPWQTIWERFMARPRHEAPDEISSANVGIGSWTDLASDLEAASEAQSSRGGRKVAIGVLRSFLGFSDAQGSELQSGKDAFEALRPHLEVGAVSPREVWQAAIGAHQHALKAGLDIRAASIASFLQCLPSLSEAHARMAEKRHSRPARSGPPAGPGHQFSLGLGDSSQRH